MCLKKTPLERRKQLETQISSYVNDCVFERTLPFLIEACSIIPNLTQSEHTELEQSGVFKRFADVSRYTLPQCAQGKKMRGKLVVEAFRNFCDPAQKTDLSALLPAVITGWCVEFNQSCFLVADDIMDQSLTRNGQPCWYKADGIGLSAINDAFFLEAAVYSLLGQYLSDHPAYVRILELFHSHTLRTLGGQAIDLMNSGTHCLSFTMQNYLAIVRWKTAFFTFILPVQLGIALAHGGTAKLTDEEIARIDTLLSHIGIYLQVIDDYLDVYGDPAITGKVGTDIQDNKCSWLVCRALELISSNNQAKLSTLSENYGKKSEACVANIKQLFDELNLREEFRAFKEQSMATTNVLIDALPSTIPKHIFELLAEKLYQY